MTILIFLILSFLYVYFLYKHNFRFISLFWTVMFSISLLLPVLIGKHFSYGYIINDAIYTKLDNIYLLCLIVFIISNIPFQLKKIRFKDKNIKLIKYKNIKFSNIVYSFLSLILIIILGVEIITTGTVSTLELNSWIKMMQASILLGFLYTSYLRFLFADTKKSKVMNFIIIIIAVLIVLTFVFGRRILIYPTIAAIIIYIYRTGYKPSILKVSILSIFSIFIGLPLLMSIRTLGIKDGVSNFIEIIKGDYNQYLNYLAIGTDVTYSYSLAAIILSEDVKITFLTLFKPLFIFIPRSIWPNKPEALSEALVHKMNLPFEKGMSIPPGLVGESYVYFGIIGVILVGIIFGVICGIADNYSQHLIKQKNGRNSINLIMIIIVMIQIIMGSIRGDTATNIQESLYLFLPLLLILNFSRYKFKI
ncbi:O-antigen polysaccharide polymerase Wzy [Staphylococcus xylosus]